MPNYAKRKIYIIDEVHMLTTPAFNALLKTLEEPPDHAYFCLATTEIHKIPETIISRCQTFLFERFTQKALIDRLAYIAKNEIIKVEPKALELISQKAEGGMRDAISLLEQINAETESNVTELNVSESLGLSSTECLNKFYKAIIDQETEDGLNILKDVSKIGGDFRTFGHDFLSFLRKKMFQNIQNQDKLPFILKIIEEIEKSLFRLKTSPIVELPLEIAVINLTQNINTQSQIPKTPKLSKSKNINQTVKPTIKTKIKTEKPIEKDEQKTTINSPEKKEIKAKNISEKKISTTISAQIITQKMSDIVEQSKIPVFAKKSFLTTNPELNDKKITFYTDSDFHRDKLSSSDISIKIKNAISQIFGGIYEIQFIKKGNSIKNKTNNNSDNKIATADDFLSF
jgi:DNA polymerase-3 subunit gamma/tau